MPFAPPVTTAIFSWRRGALMFVPDVVEIGATNPVRWTTKEMKEFAPDGKS
jgi:hypothetical protein